MEEKLGTSLREKKLGVTPPEEGRRHPSVGRSWGTSFVEEKLGDTPPQRDALLLSSQG